MENDAKLKLQPFIGAHPNESLCNRDTADYFRVWYASFNFAQRSLKIKKQPKSIKCNPQNQYETLIGRV